MAEELGMVEQEDLWAGRRRRGRAGARGESGGAPCRGQRELVGEGEVAAGVLKEGGRRRRRRRRCC